MEKIGSIDGVLKAAKMCNLNAANFEPSDKKWDSGQKMQERREHWKSSFENRVIFWLKSVYPQGQVEVATGLQGIDFYMPNQNLCIEVDGSMHYYSLSSHELSKTVMKYRLFKLAGFNVLRLEHFNLREGGNIDYIAIKDAINKAIEQCN